MASITYDGQSFMIDGRRIWVVSGSVPFARIPRDQWAARIRAAKLAGLNAVETHVIWSRHEARQGQFNFTGENDLRHFVQLVQQAGMYCILRPGPYVGAAWDMGGLPSWLLALPDIRLRVAGPAFLEACSRYITAVAQQVRDLQVTSPGEGGPVLLVQNESGWTCGHDEAAHAYLGELNRYYREAGLTVPTINANQLWQGIEGQIDCWTGYGDLLATLRQLAEVRPDQPRIVIDFKLGEPLQWGRSASAPPEPGQVVRRLAEVVAAGGQFNLTPFAGGANPGFAAGREGLVPDGFYATTTEHGALIDALGRPTPAHATTRRLCMFASRFARVLANLETRRHQVVQHPSPEPSAPKAKASASLPSVVYATGIHGSVAFVFADEAGRNEPDSTTLLLPDGTTLPVPLGDLSVVWCLFDARLTGRTNLDYCNLSAFAVLGRVFVCFGPAGTRGVLSINGSRLEVDVPTGLTPAIVEHEGIVVVVCSSEQIDAAYVDDDTLYLGVSGLASVDAAGASSHPIPHGTYKTYTRVTGTGAVTTHKASPPPPVERAPEPAAPAPKAKGKGKASAKKGTAPEPVRKIDPGPRLVLNHWSGASAKEYADGVSARFASIAGPADLDSLGAPVGYGWYRIKFRSSSPGKRRILFPGAADRLHLTLDGEIVGVVGHGPGAVPDVSLSLKKGEHTLVVLAENLGRFSGGLRLGSRVGLYDHLWAVSPLKAGAPKLVTGEPIEPLGSFVPLWNVHRSDATDPMRPTWTFQHRSKGPVFVRMGPMPVRGVLVLNDVPLKPFDEAGLGVYTIPAESLSRGNNSLQLALLGGHGVAEANLKHVTEAVELFDGDECLTLPDPKSLPSRGKGKGAVKDIGPTGTAEWAFAKWEPPTRDAYEPGTKSPGKGSHQPKWWRCPFNPDDSALPLLLDLTGMTKGQIYVNGQHLGRYFVADPNGKTLGTQSVYHIPRSMLGRTGPSELMLFEEHGAAPTKVKISAPE
ncbi:MAG: beta-galactosidase [Phycisphaeraceae bacterium]|nr:beta-galactosidase [Phycisphaeraceae bacterium]